MSRSFEITIFNCFKFNSPFFNWQGVGEEVGRETAEGSGQARDKNILFLKRTKRKNILCRVTGLRGYQGEFTFSGLEDHLFSELRRFRTSSKDELHERELVKLSAIFSDTRLDRLG